MNKNKKILSVADGKGQVFVDYARVGWLQYGFEMTEVNIDSVLQIEHFDEYRMLTFTMGEDNCDKFRKIMKNIRSRTSALIIFLPCQRLSPEVISRTILDGADQIVSLYDVADCVVKYGIALMRKHDEIQKNSNTSRTMYVAYKFHQDMDRCIAEVDGKEIALEKKELDTLAYLMENQGIIITYDQLLEKVWGLEYVGGSREVLWTQIKKLRAKIQWMPTLPQYIVTKLHIGYWFNPHFELMRGMSV